MRKTVTLLLAFLALLAPAAPRAAAAPDERATFEGHGFLALDGTRLYYEVKGRGEPVVLIHGAMLDSRMWDPQFERWSREFRVVRFDERGCGGTPLGERAYRHADDVVALLDALGIERAHLVGLSMGAGIAGDCAVLHPERVASLVLAGPGLTGFDPETAEEQLRFLDEIRAARDLGPDSLAARWLADPLMAPAMEQPALRPLLRRLTLENLGAWTQNWLLQRQVRPPTAARLSEIRVPTLVLVGDRDLPSVTATADTLARGIAGARRATIHGAGHLVNLERPAEFDAAALAFLRGVSPARRRPRRPRAGGPSRGSRSAPAR